MTTFKILTRIVAALAIYNSGVAPLLDLRLTKSSGKSNCTNKIQRGFSDKLQVISLLILIGLFFLLLFLFPSIIVLLFIVPGVLMCATSILSASKTVGLVALSKHTGPLSDFEDSSFTLIGLLLALLGMTCDVTLDIAQIQEHSISYMLGCYLFLAIVYGLYVFAMVALSLRPLKDLAKIILALKNKIGSKYNQFVKWTSLRSSFDSCTRCAYSEKKVELLRESTGHKKVRLAVCLAGLIIWDIFLYLIQYISKITIWTPLSCLLIIGKLIAGFWVRIAQYLCVVSPRHVIIISFRVSIIAAMLIVIIQNRTMLASQNLNLETATAILEFVASVIIIPTMFEWIHEVIQSKENKE